MAVRFNSGNLGTTEHSTYSIDKFNGVDYTTTPTKVDDTRAIDCSNFLPEGNSLVKRYGYKYLNDLKLILKFNDTSTVPNRLLNADSVEIINIWKGFDTGYFAFIKAKFETKPNYYGEILYFDNFKFDGLNVLYQKENVEPNTFDWYSYGVNFDGTFFILSMNEYKYITRNKISKELIISSNDYLDFYNPTVLTGVCPKDLHIVPKKLEDFNLLSTTFKIRCTVYPSLAKTPTGYDLRELFQNKKITSIFVFDITEMREVELTTSEDFLECTTADGKVVTVNVNGEGYFNDSLGWLGLNMVIDESPSVTASTTVEVILEIHYESETPKIIKQMRFGIQYGSYGHQDRLFVSGNPEYPNIDFHTAEALYGEEWEDYTYFPDTSYQAFGSDDSNIVGYGILSNGDMAIFKNDRNQQSNLFLRSSTIQTTEEKFQIYDVNGKKNIEFPYTKSIELFPVKIIGTGMRIDNIFKTIQFDNKLIFNTPDGVYYVTPDVSTASQVYNAFELSYFIRNNLNEDLTSSDILEFEGNLYILRKSKDNIYRLYIAKKDRYSFIDGKMQYEWWVLDNIPANKIFSLFDYETNKKKLYFSNENGIYEFKEGQFYDTDKFIIKDVLVGIEYISSEVFIDTIKNHIIISPTSNIWDKTNRIANKKDAYLSLKKGLSMSITNNNSETFNVTIDNEYKVDVENKNIEININDNRRLFEYIRLKKPHILINEDMYTSYDFDYDYSEATGELIARIIPISIQDSGVIYTKITLMIPNGSNIEIDKMYCNKNGVYYDMEKCNLHNGIWYYDGDESDDFIQIGYEDEILFNEFTPSFEGVYVELDINLSLSKIVIDLNFPIYSYWLSKYNNLGRLDYLKTSYYIYYVPEVRRGGEINIGYRTSKQEVGYFANAEYGIDFNDVDFSDFTFEDEAFGRTYSSKKKIKNFSFIQLAFYSKYPKDSTISSITFRYRYTKNNKGVK